MIISTCPHPSKYIILKSSIWFWSIISYQGLNTSRTSSCLSCGAEAETPSGGYWLFCQLEADTELHQDRKYGGSGDAQMVRVLIMSSPLFSVVDSWMWDRACTTRIVDCFSACHQQRDSYVFLMMSLSCFAGSCWHNALEKAMGTNKERCAPWKWLGW